VPGTGKPGRSYTGVGITGTVENGEEMSVAV
jgi:hypothetical protein